MPLRSLPCQKGALLMVRKATQTRALAIPATRNQMVLAMYAALASFVVLGTGLNWLLT